MDLYDIIEIIYNNYVDENLFFNYKLFKKEHEDLFEKLMEHFSNINDVYIYLSLYKNKNKFINSLNDLKNYLLLNYLEENKINGRTFNDLIQGSNFNSFQIKCLYQQLNKYKNIKKE